MTQVRSPQSLPRPLTATMSRVATAALAPCRPLHVVTAILVLFALTVLPSRGEEVLAKDTDSGGGFGSFLRRLMLDIVSWIGSLLGFGADRHSSNDDYPGGRGGRFPPRGYGSRRPPTASPEDVEDVPSGNTASRKPEFTSEEDLGPNEPQEKTSPEGDAVDALVDSSMVELLEGVGNLHGRVKGSAGGGGASVEEMEADSAVPLAPERVME